MYSLEIQLDSNNDVIGGSGIVLTTPIIQYHMNLKKGGCTR